MGIGMGWTDSWAMEALKEAVNERKERRNDGPHVTRMERVSGQRSEPSQVRSESHFETRNMCQEEEEPIAAHGRVIIL